MRGLWKDVSATSGSERPDENVFEEVPIREGIEVAPINSIDFWFWSMRGALSALPTASGPWIWKPPADVEPQEQLEMF